MFVLQGLLPWLGKRLLCDSRCAIKNSTGTKVFIKCTTSSTKCFQAKKAFTVVIVDARIPNILENKSMPYIFNVDILFIYKKITPNMEPALPSNGMVTKITIKNVWCKVNKRKPILTKCKLYWRQKNINFMKMIFRVLQLACYLIKEWSWHEEMFDVLYYWKENYILQMVWAWSNTLICINSKNKVRMHAYVAGE